MFLLLPESVQWSDQQKRTSSEMGGQCQIRTWTTTAPLTTSGTRIRLAYTSRQRARVRESGSFVCPGTRIGQEVILEGLGIHGEAAAGDPQPVASC